MSVSQRRCLLRSHQDNYRTPPRFAIVIVFLHYNKATTSLHKYNTKPNKRMTHAKCCLSRMVEKQNGWKTARKKNYDSTANECDVFFLFSRSNWHEILLTWRSQRKQITKRFPVVFNIDYNIDSELATIAVVGQSAGLASGDSCGDHIFI